MHFYQIDKIENNIKRNTFIITKTFLCMICNFFHFFKNVNNVIVCMY